MKKIWGLLLLVFLFSCNSEKLSNEVKKNSLRKPINEYHRANMSKIKGYSSIFKFKNKIDLETTDSSLINRIESIYFDNSRNTIIILDRKNSNVLLFDLKGNFIKSIGKRGMGPGEYYQPNPITYSNGKIVINSKNGKLLFFNLNGSLLNEINYLGKGWKFDPTKMVLHNNDLYIYTTNEYYNIGPHGGRFPVFRISKCESFDRGYGHFEENYSFSGGDLTIFNNQIIYTGIFSGDIFFINSNTNESELFCRLGPLYDTTLIRKSHNYRKFISKNIGELNAIINIGAISDLLFIDRIRDVLTIIDDEGKIIAKDIKPDFKLPEGYKVNSMRLSYDFYPEGIVFARTKTPEAPEFKVNNPSLIFYKLIYDKKNKKLGKNK